MKFYIYKIINKENSNFYIGSTTNLTKRKKMHFYRLSIGKHHSLHLQRAYNEYGKDAFEFISREIKVNTEAELRTLEERYINFCWKSGKLYNVSKKACGGDLISYHPRNKEFRDLQSKLTKERYSKFTIEEKITLSNKMKGKNNPNYGNKWNEEQRLNASKKLKEYYKTHEVPNKHKTLEELCGTEKAQEIKQKISQKSKQRTGTTNPFFGKHHTEATKKRLSEVHKGVPNLKCAKEVVYNNTLYPSVRECAKQLNIPIVTVAYRCRKQLYGFRYSEDEVNPIEGKIIWDFNKCEEIAKTCKTKKEFETKNASAYGHSAQKGYLKIFADKYFSELRHRWTLEEVIEVAKQYNSYSDFRLNETKAVSVMRWHNWTEEIKKIWD